jgi:hypothetical protein
MKTDTETSLLTEDDVFTLMGYAAVLRMDGKRDMPTFLYDLAARIALVRGDAEGARRVREVAAKPWPSPPAMQAQKE